MNLKTYQQLFTATQNHRSNEQYPIMIQAYPKQNNKKSKRRNWVANLWFRLVLRLKILLNVKSQKKIGTTGK